MRTFPNENTITISNKQKNINSTLFGNRFKQDQTLYEYLTEFLLIYVSGKDCKLNGKLRFHNETDEWSYWVEPRMGLRRFIFYDKSKKDGSIEADELAYQEMISIIKERIYGISDEEKEEYIESIQDLFHGYAVVIKKRFWGAQGLLPICPEFILSGCDPSEKKRKKDVHWDSDPSSVDTKFDFDKRNFLARGGEIYYLHILQGLQNQPEKRKKLEKLLNHLLIVQCKQISNMANLIQQIWEESIGLSKEDSTKQMNLSFIPENAYKECSNYSIDELINYLSCKMNTINQTEILAKGLVFQILRMMYWRVYQYLGIERKPWIVDMKGATKNTIRKIAANSYSDFESDFMSVLNKVSEENNFFSQNKDALSVINEARKNSLDIFRAKGKELQCIIPAKGAYERFSLSEDIVRFLVLALIGPKQKMTLNMFLEELYKHYGIVIGSREYKKSISSANLNPALASNFVENEKAFQDFLKNTGFLRELSDATSIVINPYVDIFEEEE